MKLGSWEEIIGHLMAVKDNGDGTTTLVFMVDSRMIEVTVPSDTGNLERLVNHRIGLLRTDDQQRPYIVRMIEVGKDAIRKERKLQKWTR